VWECTKVKKLNHDASQTFKLETSSHLQFFVNSEQSSLLYHHYCCYLYIYSYLQAGRWWRVSKDGMCMKKVLQILCPYRVQLHTTRYPIPVTWKHV